MKKNNSKKIIQKIKRKQTLENKTVFLHIPKTGGTTINTIITRQFKNDSIFTIDDCDSDKSINQFKKFPLIKKNKIKYIKGHLRFGIHKNLSFEGNYITILRNPIDRVISHYYYILQHPRHYLYKKIISENIDLKKYVQNNTAAEIINGQTRLISGLKEPLRSINPKTLTLEDLERAKINLKKYFKVVGTTDKFNETLILLKKAFGWNNIYYYKKNINKNKIPTHKISPEIIEIIKQKNKLDMKLYYFAQQLLDESIKNYGDSFDSNLSSFLKKNKTYSKILKYYDIINKKKNQMLKKYLRLKNYINYIKKFKKKFFDI